MGSSPMLGHGGLRVGALVVTYRPNIEAVTVLANRLDRHGIVGVVWDNSPGGTSFEGLPKGWQVVASDVNVGISAAVRSTLADYGRHGHDWLWYFDADTEIADDDVAVFLEVLGRQGADVGLVAPAYRDRSTGGLGYSPQRAARRPFTPIGSGTAYRVDAAIDVDAPDPGLPLDLWDFDLALALQEAGFTATFVAQIVLDHAVGERRAVPLMGRTVLDEGHPPWRYAVKWNATRRVARRHLTRSPSWAVRHLVARALSVPSMLVRPDRLELVRAAVSGVVHGHPRLPQGEGLRQPPLSDPRPGGIAVGLVRYGRSDDVIALGRLLNTPARPSGLRIGVTDNGPLRDPDLTALLTSGTIDVLRLDLSNPGYFPSAFAALAELREGADWLVVANADMELRLDDLQRVLDSRCAATPVVIVPDVLEGSIHRNPHIASRPAAGWFVQRAALHSTYLGHRLVMQVNRRRTAERERALATQAPAPGPMYAPHGSVVVMSRAAFDLLGPLSAPVCLFTEEIWLGEMCRRLGIPIELEPEWVVTHEPHGSTASLTSRARQRLWRDATRRSLLLRLGRGPLAQSNADIARRNTNGGRGSS